MARVLYPIHVEPVLFSAQPEIVYESQWHQPYSEPRRDRIAKALAIALIASGGVLNPYPLPAPEPVTELRWYIPFSEPVRRNDIIPYQSIADPILTQAVEPVTVDKWFQSFENTRLRRFTLTGGEVLVPVVAAPEQVTVDKWLRPFDVPIKALVRPRDLVAFIPEDGAKFGWQGPLSIPSRLRRPTQQEYGLTHHVATTPEVVTVDKWFNSLDLPWKRKLAPTGGEALVTIVAPSEVVTVDKWLRQFDVPNRRLLRTDYPITTVLSNYVQFDWNSPLNIPSWRKRHTSQNYDLPIRVTATPEVITVDKWFVSFTPIIRVRWLSAAQQQAYANPALTPAPPAPAPSMGGWSYGWSGPVRLHVLSTASQSDTVMPILPQPNPPPDPGVYTVSGLYVIDQFTDNTVVYDYGGGVSHRTN